MSRTIYVNVDSPNLGFPYLTFYWKPSVKDHPVYQPVGLEEGRGVLAMVYVEGLSVGVVGQHPLAVLPIGCLRAEVVEGEGQGF